MTASLASEEMSSPEPMAQIQGCFVEVMESETPSGAPVQLRQMTLAVMVELAIDEDSTEKLTLEMGLGVSWPLEIVLISLG